MSDHGERSEVPEHKQNIANIAWKYLLDKSVFIC